MLGIIMFVAAISNAFIGGCQYIGLEQNYSTVIFGLLLNGAANPLVFIAYVVELLEIANQKIGETNDERMNDLMSGVIFSVYYLGNFLAPIASGLLIDAIDYRFAQNIAALLCLIVFVAYSILFLIP